MQIGSSDNIRVVIDINIEMKVVEVQYVKMFT